MPAETLTAFLDESGNTGANYLDPQQPVHVVGGWIVRDSKRYRFARLVEQVQSAMDMPELKGGRMLATKKGRREMLRLHEEARAFAVPVYSIWEKRFCAALKAVETFLDPVHNPRADWLPSDANLQRNEAAEVLLRALPPSYFERFICAFREPSREGFGEVSRSMSVALQLAAEQRLAWSFAGCVGDVLDEIVEAERSTEHFAPVPNSKGLSRSVLASLNYPSFTQIIRAVDFMFESAQGRGVIVHDETSEFASSFQATFALFKRIGPGHLGQIEDGRSIRGGIGFVEELLLKKSQDEPLIQAADVLASAVKGQGLAALEMIERDEPLNALGALLLPGLVQDQADCHPWSCVASEEFKAKLMHPVILSMIARKP
jgi:hypothetical protein